MKKVIEFFKVQMRIRKQKKLFMDFFFLTEHYFKNGIVTNYISLESFRNKIILKQVNSFTLERIDKITFNDSLNQIPVEVDILGREKTFSGKNFMDEMMAFFDKVMLWKLVFICTFYNRKLANKNKKVLSLKSFLKMYSTTVTDSLVVEQILNRAMKDVVALKEKEG